MAFATLEFETSDRVAWITLNRPRVLNAYNIEMRDELYEVLSAIRDDDQILVMVLRGAGRGFCAGADLSEFGSAPSPTLARQVRFARDVWGLLGSLTTCRVAALHGFCFGSGLELALLCDLRIAAEGTLFGFPEVRLGMIPAAGGTQTIARVCDLSTALDLLLTGRRIDAREAHRLGLIHQVVAADALDTTTRVTVQQLERLQPPALRALIRAVHQGIDLPLQDGLRLEARLAATLRRHGLPD